MWKGDSIDKHHFLPKCRGGKETEFLGRVGLVYNTQPLTLETLYLIVDNSDLLNKYIELFDKVNKADVVTEIKKHIKLSYECNTLGARLVNTLINQYFIRGGLKDKEVKEISFQKKLSFA